MGKIIRYVHDFCNWRVRENKTELSCIAHNFGGGGGGGGGGEGGLACISLYKDIEQRPGTRRI